MYGDEEEEHNVHRHDAQSRVAPSLLRGRPGREARVKVGGPEAREAPVGAVLRKGLLRIGPLLEGLAGVAGQHHGVLVGAAVPRDRAWPRPVVYPGEDLAKHALDEVRAVDLLRVWDLGFGVKDFESRVQGWSC